MTFEQFCKEQGEWSQATFGLDTERGPKGPLLHLEKEAAEAVAEFDECGLFAPSLDMEIVDCFFLVIDAARRNGISPSMLLSLASTKLAINRARRWPKPTTDAPVEHTR